MFLGVLKLQNKKRPHKKNLPKAPKTLKPALQVALKNLLCAIIVKTYEISHL